MNEAYGDKHIRVSNAVAAGTTNVNTTVIDRQGFSTIKWRVLWGTILATGVARCKIQQGTAADGSDMTDLAGSQTTAMTPTTDDNKEQVVELHTTTKRYVRLVAIRGTANAVIDGVAAELSGGALEPVTESASTHQKLILIGPAEGTA